MKKIIDLSKWNTISDYNLLKRAGVDGAIIKVINSANSVDGAFYRHLDGLHKANVDVIGGYNYLYANTIAKAKAVAPIFIKMCKDNSIKTAWLDIEDACMKNLGSTLADIINIYIDEALKNDIYVGIYASTSFYNSYIKPYLNRVSFKLPVWFARYPYGSKTYTVIEDIPSASWLPNGVDVDGWQYTSKCKINGINGYIDLSVWWEDTPFVNLQTETTILNNPFTEPTQNVTLGSMGNDANWVQWYLWKFGKLVDDNGVPDLTLVNGMIARSDFNIIKNVQEILGLTIDGIVGKQTRAVFKKLC